MGETKQQQNASVWCEIDGLRHQTVGQLKVKYREVVRARVAVEPQTVPIPDECSGKPGQSARIPAQSRKILTTGVERVVADKGYHSRDSVKALSEVGVQTIISEPERGRQLARTSCGTPAAVYANRRRVRSQTSAGEYLERAGAHLYDTGGMRRVHLRGKKNIAKRALIHAAAFNLSLILRIVLGVGTARQAADRLAAVCFWFLWLVETGRRENQHPTRLGCRNRFPLSSLCAR